MTKEELEKVKCDPCREGTHACTVVPLESPHCCCCVGSCLPDLKNVGVSTETLLTG